MTDVAALVTTPDWLAALATATPAQRERRDRRNRLVDPVELVVLHRSGWTAAELGRYHGRAGHQIHYLLRRLLNPARPRPARGGGRWLP